MTGTWREREATPRALAMSAPTRRRVPTTAVKLVAVVMVAVAGLATGIAWAAWVASGSGLSAARAVSANAGNAPTPTVSGRTVSLSWPTSTYSNGVSLPTYLVNRYNSAGTVLQTISSGTCATTVTGTTCSETAVPAGSWKYTVTPAVGNWRGAESAQTAATVGARSLSLTPTLSGTPATLTGAIANFITGETLTFRLDNATSGTVLVGTLVGVATPTAVPSGGGGVITVVLPAGTTAGAHTVYAVTTPSAENASQAITVDNTPPPTPSITGSPANPTASTSATFTFTDAESPVTFVCTIDGGYATACTTGQTYSGLTSGSHTFTVAAVDPAGNTGTAATSTWTVDTTAPPVPSITVFPTGTTTSSTASFTFSDTEAGVVFTCSMDGGTAVACTSPRYYTALSNAAHTFSVTATDAAGNVSAAATKTWTVNAAVPGGALTFPVNGASYTDASWKAGCGTGPYDICGTAAAGATVVTFSIRQVSTGLFWNGSAFAGATETLVTATGTTSWSYLLTGAQQPDGNYTVRYFATNAGGNVSQPSTSASYSIDRTAPTANLPSTTNATTAGRLDIGDTLVLSTSERLLPSSVLAGWSGTSTNVVVRLAGSGGGNDVLTIWNATNTTELDLATIGLDNSGWATANVTFGLTGTPSTIVQSGSTITVTLGTVSDASKLGTVGTTNLKWTLGTGVTDMSGNQFGPPASISETDNDTDF